VRRTFSSQLCLCSCSHVARMHRRARSHTSSIHALPASSGEYTLVVQQCRLSPAPHEFLRELRQIFALYAKHLSPPERASLAKESDGMSGRNIKEVHNRKTLSGRVCLMCVGESSRSRTNAYAPTQVCSLTERKWVAKLVRGAATADLPPATDYREAIRSRQRSGLQVRRKQVNCARCGRSACTPKRRGVSLRGPLRRDIWLLCRTDQRPLPES
jgi:hypothetical protein